MRDLAALRRIQRATGLFPLGAYLLFHAWEHWPVRESRDALLRRLEATHHTWLELLLVLVPLVAHGALGLYLARAERGPRDYASARFRGLQVVTGLITGLFLVYHLLGVWLPRLREPGGVGAAYSAALGHTGTVLGVTLYAVGLAAVCTHFGQGLGGALSSLLGGRLSPTAARGLGIACGLLLWLTFLDELAIYATYASLL